MGNSDFETVHGLRSLNKDCPERNQFLVTGTGDGFARSKNLPYIYLPATKCESSQLIVENPCAEAVVAGYAQAERIDEQGSVYIERIDMLDTEYAAMLIDFPRF